MRIAVFSDIHGNIQALDAVLADIEAGGGVDGYWVLGDLAALGPSPVEVLERLAKLPNTTIIRGNTDRYVFSGVDRPPPTLEDARKDPTKLPILVECAATFAWTQGALSQGGWLRWLERLPIEFNTDLPDGTKVNCFHAAPGRDEGLGLYAGLSEKRLTEIVRDCSADLLLAGHHHLPLNQRVGRHHLVNPGSVSNPFAPDLRASYALIDANQDGYAVELHRADYDREAVKALLTKLRFPGAPYIASHLNGERHPPPPPS